MELLTEHLRLREFVPDDWQAVYVYQKDPRYLRLYRFEERTHEDVRTFVERFVDQQGETPRTKFQLAVERRCDGCLIGTSGIRVDDDDAARGNLGYEINPDLWGRGYATEAAREMLRFGIQDLGLLRVWAECNAENYPSARVLQKLGMCEECRLRSHVWYKGRFWDQLIYGIVRSDWEQCAEG